MSDSAGDIRGEERLYIDRSEELRLDLTAMFPATDGAIVKIEGINGSGKIVALGLQRIPGVHDASAFETMAWIEGARYAVVALAAIAAALFRR